MIAGDLRFVVGKSEYTDDLKVGIENTHASDFEKIASYIISQVAIFCCRYDLPQTTLESPDERQASILTIDGRKMNLVCTERKDLKRIRPKLANELELGRRLSLFEGLQIHCRSRCSLEKSSSRGRTERSSIGHADDRRVRCLKSETWNCVKLSCMLGEG